MAEKKNKNYVGKGKYVGQYNLVNFWIDTKKLQPNEDGYVYLTIGELRENDDKGNTHKVWINDFKPVKRDVPVKEDPPKPVAKELFDDQGDLPF